MSEAGLFGPFPPFKDLITYQIFSDLAVALSLVLVFIYREVKRIGLATHKFGLCFILTLLLGSFAPLIYLLLEKPLFSYRLES